MARYPLLERPLPPGWVTLRDYGAEIGRSARYIGDRWGSRPGFPEPAGELRPRGRRGGGRGELVFIRQALDDFRVTQPDLWGTRPDTVALSGRSPDGRVSLEDFAGTVAHADLELVAGHAGEDRFPAAGPDGRYRLGDLVAYWNTRPVLIGNRDRGERMALSYFADKIVGCRTHRTVTQYRRLLPPPGDDGLWELGVLADFWNNERPGKRLPAASTRAA